MELRSIRSGSYDGLEPRRKNDETKFIGNRQSCLALLVLLAVYDVLGAGEAPYV